MKLTTHLPIIVRKSLLSDCHSVSYLGNPGFKSRPEHVRFLVIFHSEQRRVTGSHLKLSHNPFVAPTFEIIILCYSCYHWMVYDLINLSLSVSLSEARLIKVSSSCMEVEVICKSAVCLFVLSLCSLR